jgi:hypothetical protein
MSSRTPRIEAPKSRHHQSRDSQPLACSHHQKLDRTGRIRKLLAGVSRTVKSFVSGGEKFGMKKAKLPEQDFRQTLCCVYD